MPEHRERTMEVSLVAAAAPAAVESNKRYFKGCHQCIMNRTTNTSLTHWLYCALGPWIWLIRAPSIHRQVFIDQGSTSLRLDPAVAITSANFRPINIPRSVRPQILYRLCIFSVDSNLSNLLRSHPIPQHVFYSANEFLDRQLRQLLWWLHVSEDELRALRIYAWKWTGKRFLML